MPRLRLGLLVLALAARVAAEGVEDMELVLHLHHSLDMGATWEERGTLALHTSRAGSATVEQAPLDPSLHSQLQNLCGEGGLYLLKAVQGGGSTLRSYTSACGLLESGLQDSITIQLDWRGKLVAAVLGLQKGPAKRRAGEAAAERAWHTRVATHQMEAGPLPDTAAFIQRMEENKRKEDRGEVKDNRSFLAKYWMYIVPVVLFMALNGAAAPAGG